MSSYDVLIVGGGHGGANAAISLRQQGFTGSIMLVSDESLPPYERPPLSKDYFLGNRPFEKMLIRPREFWSNNAIELALGTRVTTIDPQARAVTDAAGGTIGYGRLIWATGGAPRRLSCSGSDLRGVHTMRTCDDVDSLMTELDGVQEIVVIGGGYIGLEAAAAISKHRHIHVTVLEACDRVLARVAAEPLSRFYEAEHRAHGVDIELAVVVDSIEGANGRANGVRLRDGRTMPANIVIVGIGIIPEVEPLIALGAAGDAGVEVDAFCRTELPDVYAIGDCTLQMHDYANGSRIRVESVQNAVDQAAIVARAIAGNLQPASRAVPRFWSDQFDLKLQTIGLSRDYDSVVMRGDPAARSFSVAYLRDGRLIAMDCVNNPKDFVQGRNLIAAGARPDPAALADPSVPLTSALTGP